MHAGNAGRPRFALLGAAGFVARRHLEAIHSAGGSLLAVHDIFDSVGILDGYFPDAAFFLDRDCFAAYLARTDVDYVVICTPSDMHEQDCVLAMEAGANVIVEKPPVLDPDGIGRLAALEQRLGRTVHPVLQLRYHRDIAAFRALVAGYPPDQRLDVEARYVARRGPWYHVSWKGDARRSGTLIYNFGIHLFDLLTWTFGAPTGQLEAELDPAGTWARGSVEFDRAVIRWSLSTRAEDLPDHGAATNAYRRILINGEPVMDFSGDYRGLHRTVYREVLAGRGHRIEDAYQATLLAHRLLRMASARLTSGLPA